MVDTLFVCTATALAILVAGADVFEPGATAKETAGTLTQDAIAQLVGEWSRWPMALLVVVLAYTTIIGAFSYARSVWTTSPTASGSRERSRSEPSSAPASEAFSS